MESLLPYLNWASYMDGKDEFAFKTEKIEQQISTPQQLIQPQQLVQQAIKPLQLIQPQAPQVVQLQAQSLSSPVIHTPTGIKSETATALNPALLAQISPELAAHLATLGDQSILKQFSNVVPLPAAQVMLLASQQQQIAINKRNRVKRPMNSFLLFSNEMRPILQAQNKDQSNAQISKLLGNAWKALPIEEKKKYVERAAKIKTDFSAAHPDYVYTKTPRKHKKRKLSVEKELSASLESASSPSLAGSSNTSPSEITAQTATPSLQACFIPPELNYDTYFNLNYEFGVGNNHSLLTSLQAITPSDLSALTSEDRLVSEAFE